MDGKEEKYSISMIFPKTTDLSKLKKASADCAIAKWGEDKKKWPKNLRSPFRDGDTDRSEDPVYANSIFINVSSKNRPGLVDKDLQPIIDPREFYSGCYAQASLSCFAYEKAGNRGVSFGLNNLMKTRDGESLGGAISKPEEDFAELAVQDAVKGDPELSPQEIEFF